MLKALMSLTPYWSLKKDNIKILFHKIVDNILTSCIIDITRYEKLH